MATLLNSCKTLPKYFALLRRFYSIKPPNILWPIRIETPEVDDDIIYKTWADIEEELKADKTSTAPVDIGIKDIKSSLDLKQIRRQIQQNRHSKELEQSSRLLTLEIPLEDVMKDYSYEKGPIHAMGIAEHYGIYNDLFDGAVFLPAVDLGVYYEHDEETVTPVYRGNIVDPGEAKSAPFVQYEASGDSLWTLVLTNPDGHLTQDDQEYLHWMVGNIPGSAVDQGDTLCDYLQPFPPKGTGFHRHIFVLFKQESRLDYTKHTLSQNCNSLKERTFKMVEFYREYREALTPMGLCFFQCEHDDTVRNVYHNTLNMKEPVFEFKHPRPYRAVQKKFPGKEPFDRYFDRYRDKKDIAEEVLRMKMDMMCPFEGYEQKLKYPLAHYDPKKYVPTWLRRKQELMHRRLEQYEDLP